MTYNKAQINVKVVATKILHIVIHALPIDACQEKRKEALVHFLFLEYFKTTVPCQHSFFKHFMYIGFALLIIIRLHN